MGVMEGMGMGEEDGEEGVVVVMVVVEEVEAVGLGEGEEAVEDFGVLGDKFGMSRVWLGVCGTTLAFYVL